MTTVEQYELMRDQAEAFALSTGLVDVERLRQHLRDVDGQLGAARGLAPVVLLARDYALSAALLEYVRSVRGLVTPRGAA